MELLNRYKEFVKENNVFHAKDKLLVAVSGGLDSMVLTHLTKAAGFDITLAHCNFRLRGEESERDENFVREQAMKMGLPLFIKPFDTTAFAEENKLSIQVAARELRYQWFAEVLKREGFNFLLTAHHRDDNIETVLMNFCKGTGLKGLKGIPLQNKHIVRPLLFAGREDIRQYATENKIEWIDDSSNMQTKYARNYFRQIIIPSIENLYPQLKENIAHNIERFSDAEILFRQAMEHHKKRLIEREGNMLKIPVLRLQRSKPLHTIIYEIIKDFGFTSHQTPEVIKILEAETGRHISSSSHRIIKNRAWLIIAPLEELKDELVIVDDISSKINFSHATLEIKEVNPSKARLDANSNEVYIDAAAVEFPLIIRKWKAGDYFYPLGMMKKKKLARFFIDQKFSAIEKEQQWVIESNKKIIWVIGKRIDDRFKLRPSTKKCYRLKLID